MTWQFSELREASVMLVSTRRSDYVVCTQRQGRTSAQAIVSLFFRWYRDVGLRRCSSHNGRHAREPRQPANRRRQKLPRFPLPPALLIF
jgi:hypothetical protein